MEKNLVTRNKHILTILAQLETSQKLPVQLSEVLLIPTRAGHGRFG